MVEHGRNRCRFIYFDNAYFQPTKIDSSELVEFTVGVWNAIFDR